MLQIVVVVIVADEVVFVATEHGRERCHLVCLSLRRVTLPHPINLFPLGIVVEVLERDFQSLIDCRGYFVDRLVDALIRTLHRFEVHDVLLENLRRFVAC